MEKIKYGFVVLHYQALDMTIECIENLLDNYGSKSIHIAVVDNKSPNGTGKTLYDRYEKNEKVTVIVSDSNSGFARGNNLGYQYLRNNFEPDFIIDINNDVIIQQKDFLEVISRIFDEKHFALLGPNVFVPMLNVHQSPVSIQPYVYSDFVKAKDILEKQLSHYMLFYIKRELGKIYRKLLFKVKENKNRIDVGKEYSGCILHGSCLIFSKLFIEKREYAFNPCTFMYYEENILNFEILNLFSENRNAIIYSPDIQINHMDDVSTDSLFANKYKKNKWKDTECYNSLKSFLEIQR